MCRKHVFPILIILLASNLAFAETPIQSPSARKRAEKDVVAFMRNLEGLAGAASDAGMPEKDVEKLRQDNIANLSRVYKISASDISSLVEHSQNKTPLPPTYSPPYIPSEEEKQALYSGVRQSMDRSYQKMKSEEAGEKETKLGKVYVGMAKGELYKVYNPLQQVSYRKAGVEEWIVFSEWPEGRPGDTITFRLVNNKVIGWDVNREK